MYQGRQRSKGGRTQSGTFVFAFSLSGDGYTAGSGSSITLLYIYRSQKKTEAGSIVTKSLSVRHFI